jgi:hypothetical protein
MRLHHTVYLGIISGHDGNEIKLTSILFLATVLPLTILKLNPICLVYDPLIEAEAILKQE